MWAAMTYPVNPLLGAIATPSVAERLVASQG